MLQFTWGLPFAQWPVPSTVSLTVVNAAPVTACAAEVSPDPPIVVMTTAAASVPAAHLDRVLPSTRARARLCVRVCIVVPTQPSSLCESEDLTRPIHPTPNPTRFDDPLVATHRSTGLSSDIHHTEV